MTASGGAALVVVNYASSALLAQNLVGLDEAVDVVVVDNFSGAAERAAVSALCTEQGWTVLLLDDNRGFGGGVNAGAAVGIERGANVIMTLNPDARTEAASLRMLAAAAAADPLALVSPLVLTGDGDVWFEGKDLYLDDGTIAGRARRSQRAGRPRREWATGACFAVHADTWRMLGGFDEDYFMYWEDVDLSHRLLDAGGHLVLIREAVVVHDEGQTQGRTVGALPKSATYYRYNIRNRLLYAAKHLDDEGYARWRRRTPAVSYEILLQGGRRQLLAPGPWRAAARGLREGRRAGRDLRRRDAG